MDGRLDYVIGRNVVVAGNRQTGRLHGDPAGGTAGQTEFAMRGKKNGPIRYVRMWRVPMVCIQVASITQKHENKQIYTYTPHPLPPKKHATPRSLRPE